MKKQLLIIFIIPLISFSQSKIGSDILGDAAGDNLGHSVSLSGDGNTIAVGAYSFDGTNGANSGLVRVYENIGGTWTQIGSDIEGEAASDSFGISVSINSDGSIVAIGGNGNDGSVLNSNVGHVRVYENVGGTWTQVGSDIDGEAASDFSGSSVSLNSNGNIVAIGATGNDGPLGTDLSMGHVRVYENVGGTWTQVGSDIDGEAAGDLCGYSVSINSDGSIVAIGSRDNDGPLGTDNAIGHVRVYENVGGTWTQIGSDLDGEAADDNFGNSVSINSSGSVVAIGGWRNDEFAGSAGHTRVYENVGGTWTQIGSDIDGEASGDRSGTSVSISSNGTIVAIGAYFNDGNSGTLNSSGHVRIYQNQSGTWTLMGNDIDGGTAGDRLGNSVSISSNGNTVAAGGPRHNSSGGDLDIGLASVFDLSSVLSTQSLKHDYFSYYPNPVKDILHIKLNQGLTLNKVNLYNIQGQYLYSPNQKELSINMKDLKSGIYFLELDTNQGKSAKKIIIE